MSKKLYRIKEGRIFGGVCTGIGEYMDCDPVFVRLLWIIFGLMGGCGLIAYIVALFLIPSKNSICQ